MLSEIINQKIKNEGAISFHDYMDMCLYHPELGYYTSAANRIGTDGDYYTSPSLSPLFGTKIGIQLEQMWNLAGEKPFTIVEYGAGTGDLCLDILNYLKSNEKLYQDLSYCIIEKRPATQQRIMAHQREKVRWYSSISEIPEKISGCVLSNELVDNFPVHRVVMGKELMEVFVDYQKDAFVEVLQPAPQILKDYFSELQVVLPKGYQTEVNLEATEWINEVAMSLNEGFVITIDYGYQSSQLYNEFRSNGTLLCYQKHKINDSPFKQPGHQDITSHVNFSALCHWGYKNGLECCGLTKQANFLLALGFSDHYRNENISPSDLLNLVKEEAFVKHTLLVDMGSKLKVLIQKKGLPSHQLMGLKYC